MDATNKIGHAKDLFKLFSTPERIRLINLLAHSRSISVGVIAEIVNIEQSMTSRFLKDLRSNRIANFQRDAQINYYYFFPEAKQLMQHILQPFQQIQELQKDKQRLKQLGIYQID